MRLTSACSAIALLAGVALAACTPPSEAARARAMAAPPPGPRGIIASAPPADSSFYPLRCRIDGPETICKRDTQ
jgi:hypothetical protein